MMATYETLIANGILMSHATDPAITVSVGVALFTGRFSKFILFMQTSQTETNSN